MKENNFFLSIVVFLLLITGLIAASFLVQKKQLIRQKAAAPTGSITLSGTTAAGPGDAVEVGVAVDPGGTAISAVDLVITFPTDELSLEDITPDLGTNLKTFVPILNDDTGTFAETSIISSANNNGQIKFGAVAFDWSTATLTDPVDSVINPLASLHFHVKSGASGTAEIKVSHTANSTTDSNLVAAINSTDILDSVHNLSVSIGSTTASFSFQIKFQGITGQGPNKNVTVVLKRSGQPDQSSSVSVTSDVSGNYSGSLSGLIPATYDVYVKGWAHLTKKVVSNLILNAGTNGTFNWTSASLLTGDIVDNNKVDLYDYSEFVNQYGSRMTSGTNADLNADNQVGIFDYSLLVPNYGQGGD